jgi:hypothetical protein
MSLFAQGNEKVVEMCSKMDIVMKSAITRHVFSTDEIVKQVEANSNVMPITMFTAQHIMLMENVTKDATTLPVDGMD